MADPRILEVARRGPAAWTAWRSKNPSNLWLLNDLTYLADTAYLSVESELREAMPQPFYADLSTADLAGADLRGCDLSGVDLSNSDLRGANLSGANLEAANLEWAILASADLTNATLSNANLGYAQLSRARLANARIEGCWIYGIAAWDVELSGSIQKDLLVWHPSGTITVDGLDTAQFLALLLDREKLRETLKALTTKTVLILGRFSKERKQVLDAIRNGLRKAGYIPLMFDFERPPSRNLTETISTLAHCSRFVVADLTDAKVVMQELQAIVPALPSVPVQPILLASSEQNVVTTDFENYRSFLEVHHYRDETSLLEDLFDRVITPAEARVAMTVARSST